MLCMLCQLIERIGSSSAVDLHNASPTLISQSQKNRQRVERGLCAVAAEKSGWHIKGREDIKELPQNDH